MLEWCNLPRMQHLRSLKERGTEILPHVSLSDVRLLKSVNISLPRLVRRLQLTWAETRAAPLYAGSTGMC